MSDQSKLGLGQLITTEQGRDAIHVAVAPVTVAHTTTAGRHVTLDADGNASEHTGKPAIGIIDPFLTRPVEKGQKCWLFLYPGTITGLRHDWYHPSMPSVPVGSGARDPENESKRWLEHFAHQTGADYDEMMEVAETHCDRAYGEYLCQGGRWEGQGTPDEFWTHFEKVTGKKPKGEYLPGIFSCSC